MSRPDPRSHVSVEPERVANISTTEFPHHYPDEDHAWDLEEFKKRATIDVRELSKEHIQFDLVGVDTAVANAIRRVFLSDVPTVAIEKVFILLNTSIVQDEVLAQRLGLIPLAINPDLVEFKEDPSEAPNEADTIVFKLAVKCQRRPRSEIPKQSTSALPLEPEQIYTHPDVISGDLEWIPQGNQADVLPNPKPKPVQDEILLAKLRPGQEIMCEMHCEKGIGRTHAKWSPVATASYRLLPSIHLLQPIPSEDQDFFVQCFPAGVAERDPSPGGMGVRIVNPRKDTVSREVLRHEQFKGKVALGRKRDHFIFNIESAGQYQPQDLMPAALGTLLDKVRVLKEAVEEIADR